MKWLTKILMIIAIVILIIVAAIYFAPAMFAAAPAAGASFAVTTAGLTIGGVTIGTGALLAIGIGALVLAYVISPETASKTMDAALRPVGDILSAGGKAVGKTVSSVWNSLGWLKWPIIGIGTIWIVKELKE